MSVLVSAHDLVKIYHGRRVLDGITLSVAAGQRLGLVGENGAGKTTLLAVLAGHADPDGGSVTADPGVGFLPQEPPHPGATTIGQVVDRALARPRAVLATMADLGRRLQERPEDATALAAYGEALQWATDHDAWDAGRRAELVLAGLGLGPDRAGGRDRPVGSLSGGERSRLALAGLLLRQPRVLLLDEPTNHLDDQAISFVEAHLARLPGAVVLASHDRVFLDAVCTGLLDLDPSRTSPTGGGGTFYGGGYSAYLHAKRSERRAWEERHAAEQERLAELRTAVAATARAVAPGRPATDGNKMAYDRHGARVQAQVSRRVRDARRRLTALIRDQVRKPPAPLRFRAALTTGDGDGVAVALRGVRVPGRLTVSHLDLPAAGRLLVTGPNGAGKSTLLAVAAGALDPAAGTVQRWRGLRVGLLPQHATFPDPARTPRQIYQGPVPLTGLGLVAPRDLDRPVGALSHGQRRRLALACLVADPPDLLLLDEPTNHLSLSLAEELEEALGNAAGVVVASHDRWLRRRWRDPVLVIDGDHVAAPPG